MTCHSMGIAIEQKKQFSLKKKYLTHIISKGRTKAIIYPKVSNKSSMFKSFGVSRLTSTFDLSTPKMIIQHKRFGSICQVLTTHLPFLIIIYTNLLQCCLMVKSFESVKNVVLAPSDDICSPGARGAQIIIMSQILYSYSELLIIFKAFAWHSAIQWTDIPTFILLHSEPLLRVSIT